MGYIGMDGRVVSVNVKADGAGRYNIRETREMTETISRFFSHAQDGILEINEEFDHSVRFTKSENKITVQTFDGPL